MLVLQVGKTYRGKRPRRGLDYSTFKEVVDDRKVIWMSEDQQKIQYDSCMVKDGRDYPTTTGEKFLKWAKEEVTADGV